MLNANALRRSRRAAGLTRRDLAEKVGVHPLTLARYEQGTGDDIRLSRLLSLADALDVRPGELIDSGR